MIRALSACSGVVPQAASAAYVELGDRLALALALAPAA